MTEYTRISVAGTVRRVEVVVPDDEPLGTVLPQLITLLDEPSGTIARPLTLIAPGGEPLDIARTPRQQELLDGTALRLMPLDVAPPPAVVIDMTDTVAQAHDAHAGRWNAAARLAAAGVGVAVASAAGGLVLPAASAPAHLAILSGLLVAAALVGFAFGTARREHAGMLATAFGAGLALPIGADVMSLAAHGAAWAAAAAAALAAASLALLIGIGAGRRDAGAATGGAIGVVLGGVLLVLLSTGSPVVGATAIIATIAVFIIGALPWTALAAAGLTGLDDAAESGGIDRAQALAAVDTAYRTLTWGVAATASVVAIAGVLLVGVWNVWACLIALATALAVALRARTFPLRGHGWMLWSAVATIGAAAIIRVGAEEPWWAVTAAASSIVVIIVTALISPRPHQRARLRALGNTVEMLAVIALIPLTLGAFGIYAELFGLFGSGS